VRKLALAAACAGIVLAATASAAGPSLSPHVWGVRVSGAPVSAFNATWLIGIQEPAFTLTRNRGLAVEDGDLGAARAQPLGRCGADPARAARDQGDAAREVVGVRHG